ncbi:HupE/UreJ family protein [Undibacterium sp. RuRC25W]|uniref:HupE/UreJ family protein n=1 Tax=Undibacterium sp. RuRC25W TaxID=3413047 RepID=UPI003BF01938
MKTKRMTWLTKILGLCGLSLFALPASAHISVMHSVGGFEAGLMHPITGLDHLLAMIAVGMWAAKNQRSAQWVLPVVFPLMMAIGAIAGASGLVVPGVEAGIAASLLVLGLCIALMARLPVSVSAGLVGVFALAHGYAHGVELPSEAAGAWFGVGFLIATVGLHAVGFFATRSLQQIATSGRASVVYRGVGAAIAMSGMYFFSALI